MRAELVAPDSPRWTSVLGRVRHDFYHLPTYVRASATFDGGEAKAIVVDDGERVLLLPIVARPIPGRGGLWDATSPYGYPGPLVDAAAGADAFAADALAFARAELASRGCVSLFVRLHPILGPTPRPAGAALVQHGETVSIDLTRSTEDHWRETMSGHRNEINRAMRAGHRAYVDEGFRHLDRFVAIYQATMRRVGASAYYLFSRDYVVALREALGPRLKLVVVEIGDAIAGAGLFVETGDLVQYHLSGTDEAFARERPTKLMLHFVRGWAKERGARDLHLGGGVGGAKDSLFAFKAGFSSRRHTFHTLRMVTDDAAYRALSDGRSTSLDGFFPAYRAPKAES